MHLRTKSRRFYFGNKILKLIFGAQIFVSKRVFFQKNRKSKFLKISKNIEKSAKNGSKRDFRKKLLKQKVLEIKFYVEYMSHMSLLDENCGFGRGVG